MDYDGIKLPIDLITQESPAAPFEFTLPAGLSKRSIIALFSVFLHRTSGQENILFRVDDKFARSSINAEMTFSEFEKRIAFVTDGKSSVTLTFGAPLTDTLSFSVRSGKVSVIYDPLQLEAETVERWIGHLKTIAQEAVKNPAFIVKKFCYLSDAERKRVVEEWNGTEWAFPEDKLLHEFIEEQAAKHPGNEAVRFAGRSISYRALDERATCLADLLRKEGVGRDVLVAICMDRSIELVVGLLAILKAGGAYVPMDPSYPEERLNHILSDSQAAIFLTHSSQASRFQSTRVKTHYLDLINFDTAPDRPLPRINSTEDLCYVIYTSGSTGKPKGAGNIHKGVVNRILWMQDKYPLDGTDRVLQKTPFGFDVSVWEFFWPLMVGATLVMAEPEIHKDAEALADLIQREKITTLHFVPSMLNVFLEADVAHKCSSLRRVFASGEALSKQHQNRFFGQFKAELHNLYGPTEASIDVTYWKCDPADGRTTVPIGRPIANTQIYILDEFMQPVPIGVAGELFIGGVGLAREYVHKEELTKQKFVPHPFIPGKRVYRTGDLCRFLPDGAIEYLGRIDHQIKLRGFRIELGEIEAVIRKEAGVKNATVIPQEIVPGQKYLAAYLIVDGDREEIKNRVVASLKLNLPEYMVPSSFVFLDKFPISPNGKLDTKLLPIPLENERSSQVAFVEPRTEVERSLAAIWKELLKLDQVGIKDSFFALGGHSILAMHFCLRVKKGFGKKLPLSEVFIHQTIEQLASLFPTLASVSEKNEALVARPEEAFNSFPLTDIQRAYLVGRSNMFALGEIRSHVYAENEKSTIDVPRLERALNRLIVRHPMLRAVMSHEGTQKILETVPHYTISVHQESVERVRSLILNRSKESLEWPYFDVRCTHVSDQKSVVHFYLDLMIADGTGLEVLFEELSQLYTEEETSLPALDVTYRDALLAMENPSEEFEKAREYWFKRIDTLPDAPELPTIGKQQEDALFVRRKGGLPKEEWHLFQQKAADMGVTVAALLATLYGETLKTWVKSPYFTLNLMFFNRPPIHEQIDRVVGNFSSTLLLEMDVRGKDPIDEKAKRVQKQLLQDLEHHSFNGVKVLNEMNRRRGGSSAAAMPVVFACALNLRTPDPTRPLNTFKWYGEGTSYTQLETPQVWFDFQVFEDESGAFCFHWDVREGYFPKGLVDVMFQAYTNMLHEIIEDGSLSQRLTHAIPLQDEQLIQRVNSTEAPRAYGCLHEKILEQIQHHPERTALITSSRTINYREFGSMSQALATELNSCKLQPDDLVAIVMDKGWEQAVAVLAIHMAGAAYLPIDAALPEDRIVQLLTISKCRAVIVQKKGRFTTDLPTFFVDDHLKRDLPFKLSALRQRPNHLAYVIFTSGSTGVPKGVMIEHSMALNTVEAITKKYRVTENDRCFAISSLSFDLSVYDLFGLLRAGGSLYIPTGDETKNPDLWLKALSEAKITLWNSAPAQMQLLMNSVELNPPSENKLRLVMMSGDWIPIDLPNGIKKHFSAEVMSLGGATEAAIWSNDYKVETVDESWPSIPYGKALPNQSMFILDENLEPRPVWATGMIYIGGWGLARGYFNDEEKTAKSFLYNPKTRQRLYRTGDLGRLRPDGNIEFLGREDLQVKIQGYRIELEEIEAVIAKLPGVQRAVVRILGGKNEGKQIAAFFTGKVALSPIEVKEFAEKKLPFYMVPNQIIQVEAFPLNSNGKVDLKALMSLLQSSRKEDRSFVEPVGEKEIQMAKIWAQLLKVDRIGRDDDFFALGGTSFLAFQMIHQVQKEMGLSLSLSSLFQHGTIKDLVGKNKRNEDSSFVVLQAKGAKPPLFFVHPSGGGVLCYAELAQLLGEERPFYAFQSPGFMESRTSLPTIEEMAAHYVSILLKKQPEGPYQLGGWSLGGVIAYQMATQLKAMGREIFPLLFIDSPIPVSKAMLSDETLLNWLTEDYGAHFKTIDQKTKESLFKTFKNNIAALLTYRPERADIDLIQMKATDIAIDHLKTHPGRERDDWGWSDIATGQITTHLFDAEHSSILKGESLAKVAQLMKEAMAAPALVG
jgi:amino acid adenylation domain-containing protein